MKNKIASAAVKAKFPPRRDVCPKCRIHFNNHQIFILWKDVAECKKCGHIWVLLSLNEYLRWN